MGATCTRTSVIWWLSFQKAASNTGCFRSQWAVSFTSETVSVIAELLDDSARYLAICQKNRRALHWNRSDGAGSRIRIAKGISLRAVSASYQAMLHLLFLFFRILLVLVCVSWIKFALLLLLLSHSSSIFANFWIQMDHICKSCCLYAKKDWK